MEPGLTYKIDTNTNRITTMIDNDDSIIQAVHKNLNTQRYAFDIYGWAYGLDMEMFVAEDLEYIQLHLPKYLRESLLRDDRIVSVDNINIVQQEVDSCLITFDITTREGTVIQMQEEMNYAS